MGLFKSAWLSENEDEAFEAVNKLISRNKAKAIKAIKQITNQSILFRIAIQATHGDASFANAAIEKITDQSKLKFVAQVSTNGDVCRTAITALTDQNLIDDIAKDNTIHNSIRLVAVRKVVDKALLKDIAENDVYDEIRKTAKNKLSGVR